MSKSYDPDMDIERSMLERAELPVTCDCRHQHCTGTKLKEITIADMTFVVCQSCARMLGK